MSDNDSPSTHAFSDLGEQGKTNALLIIENERIVYASPRYLEMMEYDEGSVPDLEGKRIRDNIHPDDREKLARMVEEVTRNKQKEASYSFREKTQKGRYICREDHAYFHFDEEGRIVRTYVVCREVPCELQTAGESGKKQQTCLCMIAEDNRINMMLVKNILMDIAPNCEVVEAWNGQEAVEHFKRHRPHLVLMDIHMPEKDGYQATREIREYENKHSLPRTPIIAVTARTKEGERERCLEAGMDDYVPKPVQENEFSRAVRTYLHVDPNEPGS